MVLKNSAFTVGCCICSLHRKVMLNIWAVVVSEYTAVHFLSSMYGDKISTNYRFFLNKRLFKGLLQQNLNLGRKNLSNGKAAAKFTF